MANLMLYAKEKGEKCFGAVNMASGTFPVGLMYATLVPEAKLEILKQRASLLHRMNPDITFQIRYAGTAKVFVDVAVDQGGCGETTRVTYHDDPIFIEDGVVHYCVGNMPGAVPRTSTIALTNATVYYGLQIANKGLEQACKENEVIYSAINTYDGKLTCKNVADSFDCYEYVDIKTLC